MVDAIAGAVILGVALAALLGVVGRAIDQQARGEELRVAAMLLDEQLNLVLMRGADSYETRFDTEGACDPPFEGYTYRIEILGGEAGFPYLVRATVSWDRNGRTRSESVETLIAPRLGDDPDPERTPDEGVTREP